MANWVINGETFPPFVTAFVGGANFPASGQYYADGNYGDPPFETEPLYREAECEYTGVDGVGINRFNFLGLMIYGTIIVVGTTSNVRTTLTSLRVSFRQLERYTIALPGGASYDGCRLVSTEKAKWVDYFGNGSIVAATMPCTFRQYSTTN